MLKIHNLPSNICKINKPLLLAGDDDYLKQDACELFIQYWQKQKFKIKRFTLNTVDDWHKLIIPLEHKSLIPEFSILVCSLNQKSITKKIDEKFSEKFNNLPKNIKIVFVTNKLSKTLKTKAIIKNTSELSIWPMKPLELDAWILEQAKFLNISLSKNIVNQVKQKANLNPCTIKNYLKILASNNILEPKENDMHFCISETGNDDCWNIIELAFLGKTKELGVIIKNYEKNQNSMMNMYNVMLYSVKNMSKIAENHSEGKELAAAIRLVSNWPKQQSLYNQAYLRNKKIDWHKIILELLEIELILKGAKTNIPIWHKIEDLLFKFAKGDY